MLCIGSGFCFDLRGLTIAFDNDVFIKTKPTLFSLSVALPWASDWLASVFFRISLKAVFTDPNGLDNSNTALDTVLPGIGPRE